MPQRDSNWERWCRSCKRWVPLHLWARFAGDLQCQKCGSYE
jgi:hypothetical protein